MQRSPPFLVFISLVVLVGLVSLPSTGFANEIWLEPAKQDANRTVGNWPTAKLNRWRMETHFAFHIPAEFDSFTKAVVVLIPWKTTTFPWRANLSVAGDGQPHDALTNSETGSQEVTKNNVTEVDVSAVFPESLASSGYVSLNFVLGNRYRGTRVVGMRFKYASTGGGGGGDPSAVECPCFGMSSLDKLVTWSDDILTVSC